MTELEAVNTILAVIGEAPVESLATEEENTISEAALAYQTLQEVERDLQAEGWGWNTDIDYTLTKDGSDQFLVPSSTLRVEFSQTRYPDQQYVLRGLKVYDRNEHTSTFPDTDTLVVNQLVRRLTWDEIPHAAQQYVMIRAARMYAARFTNSNSIVGYTQNDEQYARAMLIRDEESRERHNLLWGNQRGNPHGNGFLPARGRRYRVN